jgi:hypothetical protein
MDGFGMGYSGGRLPCPIIENQWIRGIEPFPWVTLLYKTNNLIDEV